MWMRAEASEAERPWVSDVESFRAVSRAESSEWADVMDEGVVLRLGASGGCSMGEEGREDLEGRPAAL
jgi:hypothetical protein